MNMKKTKMMFSNYRSNHEIKVGVKVIECVNKYTYLGQNQCKYNHEKK